MRPLKFRAWDKIKNEFILPENLVYRLDGHLFDRILDEELHDVELIQFTGSLDKNGKEIYEGDYDQDYNVVTWCERKMGWTMSIYDFPTKEVIACHCYDCEGHFEIRELENIEIIGNIYEEVKQCT